jgi:hypothetical protein
MSEEHENDIIQQLEQLSKLAPLIRYLIGGAIAIATAVLSVGGWVWHTSNKVDDHEKRLDTVEPKTISLEHWRAVYEARPMPSTQDVFLLDKRLQRVEDGQATMIDTLKRIEGKL